MSISTIITKLIEAWRCKDAIKEKLDIALKLREKQREVKRLKEKLSLIEGKVNELTTKLEKSEEEVDDLIKEKTDLSERLGEAIDEIEKLRDKIKELEQQETKTASFIKDFAPPYLKKAKFDGEITIRFLTENIKGYYTYKRPNGFFAITPEYEYLLEKGNFNKPDLSAQEVFKRAINIVVREFSYQRDSRQWGKLDNWTPANVVLLSGRDDCESLSALVVSLFKYYELKFGAFEDWECVLATGHVDFFKRGDWSGHGFPVLLYKEFDEDKILVGEATMPHNVLKLKDSLDEYVISSIYTFPTKNNNKGYWLLKKSIEEKLYGDWWKNRKG
jgi:hypothetical protein